MMKVTARWISVLAALSGVTAAGVAHAASAEVRFVGPGRDSDLESPASGRSGGAVIAELASHVRGLATRGLPADQRLVVDLIDVDLAGRNTLGYGGSFGTRIVSDRTPPRIRLRWALREGRRTLKSGEETLFDPNIDWSGAAQPASDPLRREKELLTNWFRRRIADRELGRP